MSRRGEGERKIGKYLVPLVVTIIGQCEGSAIQNIYDCLLLGIRSVPRNSMQVKII